MNLEKYSVNMCAEFDWIKIGEMIGFEECDEKSFRFHKSKPLLNQLNRRALKTVQGRISTKKMVSAVQQQGLL
jgi:hypothetical protein